MKKIIKLICGFNLCLLIVLGFAHFSHAEASPTIPMESDAQYDNGVINSFDSGSSTTSVTSSSDSERNNFDIASLLSLLGIGLLKFIDDKLKIKLKDNYSLYKKILCMSTAFFSVLLVAILFCYITHRGPTSFGNLKNLFLGLIPVIFCLLTLYTAKNESDTVLLSHDELETRINDFTSSGMSPLGMIVGDMDFFGNVYNEDAVSPKKGRKVKHVDNIINNSQINALVKNRIDNIMIVCKPPATKESFRRIGYLLYKFEEQLHIKFFNETKYPIPKMRGRIMYKQNVQVVVITKKIRKPSQYEYSEYPVSSLPGGLFADLWNAVWGCGEERPDLLERCKLEYFTYTNKLKEGELHDK